MKKDKTGSGRAPYLRTTNLIFVIAAMLTALALFLADNRVTNGFRQSEAANERYLGARITATELEAGSDYLTDRVRCFVVTGDARYLNDYFEEVEITRRRDTALSDLDALLEGSDSEAYDHLSVALRYSNELMEREYLAMRLTQEALGIADVPDALAAVTLTPEQLSMTSVEQREAARDLVFDEEYMSYKERIAENVDLCTKDLILREEQSVSAASARMNRLLTVQTVLTALLLLVVLLLVLFISREVRKPLTRMVERMRAQETVPPAGAAELQFVTRTYNEILEENRRTHQKLTYEASHDALTGLYNRNAYDMFCESVDMEHAALVLADVDYFKSVNDTYGHDAGDRVLKRVADVLKHNFRSVDIICRIGGDEFVVILNRVSSSMGSLMLDKITRINEELSHAEDGLPPVSLSVGIAFSDRENAQGDIFKDADTALYRVKEAGRHGVCVYPDKIRQG